MKQGNSVVSTKEYMELKKLEDNIRTKMVLWRTMAYGYDCAYVYLDPIDEFKKIREAIDRAELNEKKECEFASSIAKELNFYRSMSAFELFLFKLRGKKYEHTVSR